jgi:O-antigen/teichoic acid export membrane protein
MFVKLQSLFKLSSIYILGMVLNKGAVFLLVPLYVRYLTVSEYGMLAIFNALSSAIKIVLSFGIQSAAFRFYFVYKDPAEKKNFYGTIWVFLATISGSATLGLTYFVRTMSPNAFIQQIVIAPYAVLILWSVFFQISFEMLPLQILRASEKAHLFVGFNLFSFLLTSGLNIYFVAFLKEGVLGILRGNLIASILMAILYSFVMIRYAKINFLLQYLRPALRYSVPLIPHFFSNWLLSLSDRWILEKNNVGLDVIGIYSLADQFRQGYDVITWGVNSAILPIFGHAQSNDKCTNDKILPPLVTYYVLGILSIALGISMFVPEIVRIIARPAFYDAQIYVVWLIAGGLVSGLYFIPMNVMSQIVGNTKNISGATFLAGITNISLNLFFVPRYGVKVAAINTVIGYSVQFIIIFMLAQRLYPIKFEYRRISLAFAAGAIAFLVSRVVYFDGMMSGFLYKSVSLLVFPFTLSVFGFFSLKEKKQIRRIVRSIFLKE